MAMLILANAVWVLLMCAAVATIIDIYMPWGDD